MALGLLIISLIGPKGKKNEKIRWQTAINSNDTSVSRSKQLELAVPPSKIATLSSGELVGMVADDPACKIERKLFHACIQNHTAKLKAEEENYKEIPVRHKVSEQEILDNYMQVKLDVQLIIEQEMENLRCLKTDHQKINSKKTS